MQHVFVYCVQLSSSNRGEEIPLGELNLGRGCDSDVTIQLKKDETIPVVAILNLIDTTIVCLEKIVYYSPTLSPNEITYRVLEETQTLHLGKYN